MKVTYDKSVDAAYIYLDDNRAPGSVAKTCCCDPTEVNGQINLDLDAQGRLIGIEVLDASKKLPVSIMRELAEQGLYRS